MQTVEIIEYDCTKCSKPCRIGDCKDKQGSQSFRCIQNKNHEYSIFTYSYLSKSHADCRDVLQFIRGYLERNSLHLCSVNAGISYNTTAVFWAKQLRQFFIQYVFDNIFSMKFDGEVELDESLFGKKCKYHKRKDTGCKVWIFRIVERSTNRLILYLVDRRNKQTLIPLIKMHIKPCATIFSDGWAAYLTLNDEGFSHFTVSHKTTFRQSYENTSTGETVDVDTNTIEGAWKHCKDCFRKINGVKLSTFESHLSEILWRNHHSKSNIYQAFFDGLKGVYNLKDVPEFTYEHPIFKETFNMSENEKVIRMSDVSDTSDCESDQVVSVHAVSVQTVSDSLSVPETFKEKRGGRKGEKQKRRSSSLPMTRGRARKKDGCPLGFKQVQTRDRFPNPYSKINFVAFESSDDDFDN